MAYSNKQIALDNQIKALEQELLLKRSQLENKILQAAFKVSNDSIKLVAAKTNTEIALSQFERVRDLEVLDLKAVREVEDKKLKLQEAQANEIAQANDFEKKLGLVGVLIKLFYRSQNC